MDTEILAKLLRRNEVLTKAHSQETLGTWACANRTVCDPLELGAAELPDSAVTFDGADHGVAETPARNCELAPVISPTPTREWRTPHPAGAPYPVSLPPCMRGQTSG